MLPVGSEAKGLLTGWLGSLGLDPPHWDLTGVEEAVSPPHAGPDHVTGLDPVALTIEDSLGLASEQEVALLEGMVVHVAGSAGLELDHEHGEVLGTKHPIDHHLERDPLHVPAAIAVHLEVVGRRKLVVFEVAEE